MIELNQRFYLYESEHMKLVILMFSLFIVACAQDPGVAENEPAKSTQLQPSDKNYTPPPPSEHELKAEKPTMLTLRGTIVWKALEGGFFGFDGENGKKYFPNGLKNQYRQHGLIVEITGEINTQMVTFQQYGPVLMVKSVKVIDDSKVTGKGSNTM